VKREANNREAGPGNAGSATRAATAKAAPRITRTCTDPNGKFPTHGRGYTLLLTRNGGLFSLQAQTGSKSRLEVEATPRIRLVGSNPNPEIAGGDELSSKVNYLIGDDPKKWRTNSPTFANARYMDTYPGTDLLFHRSWGKLEFDFIVPPGADPHAIAIGVEDATRMHISLRGELVLSDGQRELELEKPVVYQEVRGKPREVTVNFELHSPHRLGFALSPYDSSPPFVVEPTLVYSICLGGSVYEYVLSIAIDSSGNDYVVREDLLDLLSDRILVGGLT
jgi:hypothetical protein